jgi:C4-dicarboxylate transporter/malic acid transport protein
LKIARQFGVNWFTTVMGVGIVSALTYASPVHFPFQHGLGEILFVLVNLIFVVALSLWAVRWILHTDEALADFSHPTRALFYGALAMGINVVGNAYFIIGSRFLPSSLAFDISKGLWVAGVTVSIFTVIVVPYLLFTKHEVSPQDALASWLIPVVPPIVAAATGTNLIPLWGGPSLQAAVLFVIIAMFGMTFFLFLMVSALVYSRLVFHRRLSGDVVPSLWVEIGPIGMSMAIFSTLPFKMPALLAPYAAGLHIVGLLFAISMWGVGVWWIVISSMHTLMHLGKHGEGIPFNLGWWSYVFPIGSFTTGTYAIAHLTHAVFFQVAGVLQLGILWFCFAIVFYRTLRGVIDGSLITWRKPRLSAHRRVA